MERTCITLTPLLWVNDPESFAKRLLATSVSRFIMQPFHFQRGRFVAGTRDAALGPMAEKLGTSPGDFRAAYDPHYRVVREVLMRRFPAPGEGRLPLSVLTSPLTARQGSAGPDARAAMAGGIASCALPTRCLERGSHLAASWNRSETEPRRRPGILQRPGRPFQPTNLTGLGTLRAGESQRRSARSSPYARCRGFSESSLRSASCRARC